MNPDVLVIGAGLGGLSCAVELARQGLKVRLLEAAELPGGCLRTFRKRGHHFHMSPQYLGSLQPGGAADAILVALGVRDQSIGPLAQAWVLSENIRRVANSLASAYEQVIQHSAGDAFVAERLGCVYAGIAYCQAMRVSRQRGSHSTNASQSNLITLRCKQYPPH